MFTKKHFEVVARCIATIKDYDLRVEVCHTFTRELRNTNPRFNVGTFTKACDVAAKDEAA